MTDKVSSSRRILKSSSITGGASVINIVIGLVRTKVLAMLLGPMGLGLVSLYAGIITTATSVATMGVNVVGTRQIAEAIGHEDIRALAVARRAMFWGSLLLACVGALVVWALREVLAIYVLGGSEHASIVGWMALGVALSVSAASQGALIQGMRRIGDMARRSVYGSILNTVLGIALLWQWGAAGLVAFVLIGPLVNFLLGYWYVLRLPKVKYRDISLQEMAHQWQTLLRLGIPFMGAGLVGMLVQLWIRVKVGSTLGAESLGYFQAAWTISMQYIGFVLAAMGADYYPRLTGIIHDHNAASRLVNEQTEIALLLSAPIFIAMISLTPWVVHLLYTSAFMPAVNVLRWQILGDIFKVAGWPLGFVILAVGDGNKFFWTESFMMLLMGGLIAGLVATIGLQITGIAFLVMYIVYLPVVYLLAKRRIGFQWSGAVVRLLTVIFAICVSIGMLASMSRWGGVLGCVMTVGFGLYGFGRITYMAELSGSLGKMGETVRRLTMKIGFNYY